MRGGVTSSSSSSAVFLSLSSYGGREGGGNKPLMREGGKLGWGLEKERDAEGGWETGGGKGAKEGDREKETDRGRKT